MDLNFIQVLEHILIIIVGIDLFYRQGRVAIASPTAAKIEFIEDAAYAEAAAENQSQGVILAIAGVWELYLAKQRREESTRSTKSVDAKCIVGAVLVSPFAMADKAWRQGI